MADKPETKVDPKPIVDQPDPELAQLAAQISGEPDLTVVEGKDSVSSPDQPVSKGKDTPASEKEDEPESEGDDEPGEGEEEGGQEDPLKDLAADAKGALKVLLEHPVLGPLLNRWSDNAAIAQVTSALDRERPNIEADAKRTEAERAEDAHFTGMTQEQVAEELADNENAATAYARYQQRKQSSGAPNAEAVTQASQIYAYASDVSSVISLLEESELTAEVKESIKPEHFTHLGAEGIKEWKKAVLQAVITHEATAIAAEELANKKETLNEEVMAEVDGERPAVVSGRRDGPTPDLMNTDSGVLLEGALSEKPKKG